MKALETVWESLSTIQFLLRFKGFKNPNVLDLVFMRFMQHSDRCATKTRTPFLFMEKNLIHFVSIITSSVPRIGSSLFLHATCVTNSTNKKISDIRIDLQCGRKYWKENKNLRAKQIISNEFSPLWFSRRMRQNKKVFGLIRVQRIWWHFSHAF